jgi:hypothetical protein
MAVEVKLDTIIEAPSDLSKLDLPEPIPGIPQVVFTK